MYKGKQSMMSLMRESRAQTRHSTAQSMRAAALASLRDKVWLAQELENKTVAQIARQIDIETATVYRYISKHELQLPMKRKPNENANKLNDKEWLANEIKTKSGRQIAQELGINNTTVNQRILHYGLRPPLKSKPVSGKPVNKKSLQVWFEQHYGNGFHNWY